MMRMIGALGCISTLTVAVAAAPMGHTTAGTLSVSPDAKIMRTEQRGEAFIQEQGTLSFSTATQGGTQINKEFYVNDGSIFMNMPGQWLVRCHELPATTKFIMVTYGTKTDYFKPVQGETFCSMLVNNTKHMWSPDGTDSSWVQPEYDTTPDTTAKRCGGSKQNWPKENIQPSGSDDREFLASWCIGTDGKGNTDQTGGMGSASGAASWNQAFKMEYRLEYTDCNMDDGKSESIAYPCECGTSVCVDGAYCDASANKCNPITDSTSPGKQNAATGDASPNVAAGTAATTNADTSTGSTASSSTAAKKVNDATATNPAKKINDATATNPAVAAAPAAAPVVDGGHAAAVPGFAKASTTPLAACLLSVILLAVAK